MTSFNEKKIEHKFKLNSTIPVLVFQDEMRAALKYIRHQAENLCQPPGPLKSLMLSFMF